MKVPLVGGQYESCAEPDALITCTKGRPLQCDTEPKKHGDPLWQAAAAVHLKHKINYIMQGIIVTTTRSLQGKNLCY